MFRRVQNGESVAGRKDVVGVFVDVEDLILQRHVRSDTKVPSTQGRSYSFLGLRKTFLPQLTPSLHLLRILESMFIVFGLHILALQPLPERSRSSGLSSQGVPAEFEVGLFGKGRFLEHIACRTRQREQNNL